MSTRPGLSARLYRLARHRPTPALAPARDCTSCSLLLCAPGTTPTRQRPRGHPFRTSHALRLTAPAWSQPVIQHQHQLQLLLIPHAQAHHAHPALRQLAHHLHAATACTERHRPFPMHRHTMHAHALVTVPTTLPVQVTCNPCQQQTFAPHQPLQDQLTTLGSLQLQPRDTPSLSPTSGSCMALAPARHARCITSPT